jgi:outer membrane protein assembly factor BamE (lipoprotein component of BamABCDE complex)
MKNLCLLLALLSLSGCITVGKPFPVTHVPSIELNRTTQRDLLAVFGEPHRTGIDDGDVTWTYVHYRLRAFGDQETRDLYLRFNKDGTVKSYSFNSSLDEDREALESLRRQKR